MNNDANIEIGKRLFDSRKSKGLTRAELGKILKLHESTIKRYEDGEIKNLSIDKLKEFAEALDVSPAYLMGWEEKKMNQLETIAAHFEGEEFTEDDMEDIDNFIKYVLSKKKK